MRQRTHEEQQDFRESLFNEHYQVFNRKVFCHATLLGFWNMPGNKPQKVDAHHIEPFARVGNDEHVHHVSNGILLDRDFHKSIHLEYGLRRKKVDVEEITKEFIGKAFNANYKLLEPFQVDIWEAHLVSKNLIMDYTNKI